ncbi:MAG: hypothetical protein ACYDD1_16170 [Caulobacteraceae bacterium]
MNDENAKWYLREWMAHFKKERTSLVAELGWEGKRAHQIWHGQQSYRRKDIAQVAEWLGLEPHELLMKPADALSLRSLRKAAMQLIAGGQDGTET